jgi:2-oxoglutarate/2-oxoacid ferredoxin oxidoreductase subunit beta
MSNCTCSIRDFFSDNLYTWCTNCGNYGIHAAVKRALVAECLEPQNVLLCFDIGCHGNGSDKIGGYRAHGLHGRVLPFACGASVANRRVKVLAFGGDGGTLGEGINHLVHAVRGNYPVLFVLHNNLNYGLTQGQASSTTKPGMKMNSSPDGITSDPIHPMRFLLSLQPSFAARTFSGDIHHMTKTFQAGLQHNGFAFIEVLQSCPTYNRATPHEWYQERVYNVEDTAGYNQTSYADANRVSEDLETKIALGVLYQDPTRQTTIDRAANRQNLKTELVDEVITGSIDELLPAFN